MHLAKVSVAHLNDCQLFLNQFDKWQEVLPVQSIFVQLCWCLVGGEQYHSPFPEQS